MMAGKENPTEMEKLLVELCDHDGDFSEEFGFVGAIIIVFLLFRLILRCFRAAQHSDNTYGRYICTGVGAMLLFHVFENVGMCIGLMPVTGIPPPFISYGCISQGL